MASVRMRGVGTHAKDGVDAGGEEDLEDLGQALAVLVLLDEVVLGLAGVGPAEQPVGADDHAGDRNVFDVGSRKIRHAASPVHKGTSPGRCIPDRGLRIIVAAKRAKSEWVTFRCFCQDSHGSGGRKFHFAMILVFCRLTGFGPGGNWVQLTFDPPSSWSRLGLILSRRAHRAWRGYVRSAIRASFGMSRWPAETTLANVLVRRSARPWSGGVAIGPGVGPGDWTFRDRCGSPIPRCSPMAPHTSRISCRMRIIPIDAARIGVSYSWCRWAHGGLEAQVRASVRSAESLAGPWTWEPGAADSDRQAGGL